jgi:uncharacterized membrane protein YcgQ (UPF0703/DUF1980 family)
MSSSHTQDDRRLRKNRIVWAAFTFSVVLYFMLMLLIPPAAVVGNISIERVLMVLAVAYVLLSIPAKRWLLVQADSVDSSFLRGLAFLVPLLLCEVAALTGVVLRLAAGSSHYYVFLTLALVGMLLHFPRRDAVGARPDSGS